MRHRLAHVVFPSDVPGFERGELRKHDEDGHDLAVPYHGVGSLHELVGTVFVYPATTDLESQLDRACAEDRGQWSYDSRP